MSIEQGPPNDSQAHITVRNLTMAYGSFVLMRDLDFTIRRGEIFIIMGGSGCGKSTLLRHLVGLNEPASGEVWYEDVNFTTASDEEREPIRRRFGILFQSGALWSSMTLAENVGLPLEQFTPLAPAEIGEAATLKLALVGLRGFEDYFPSGARPRGALLRRAVRRSRSGQLASARRAHRSPTTASSRTGAP